MNRHKVFIIVCIVGLFAIVELCSRGYFAIKNGLSILSPVDNMVFLWYPELKNLEQYKYEDDNYNILFLGGSVLDEGWGDVPQFTKKKFSHALNKKINLINVAVSGHSSLDSFYKYQWIGDKRFDLVVFYHGINEIRTNNVPQELWEKDYSHYAWYSELNFYFQNSFFRKTGLALPYFIRHIITQFNRDKYVPEQMPKEEWTEFGKKVKTKESFKNNYLKIIKMAKNKNETLLIPTFAHYRPEDNEDYTNGPNMGNTWTWGRPENVFLGLNIHNTIIRHLASREDFIFLDIEKIMKGNKGYFRDICHFTTRGSEVFVHNVLKQVMSQKIGQISP